MKHIHIKEMLEDVLCVSLSSINLGDFDTIAELTAKRERKNTDPLYRKVGRFYRSNYERGILMYYLVRRLEFTKNVLEIGHGRGYVSLCCAKALCERGSQDSVVDSVEIALNEQYFNALTTVYPKEWFSFLRIQRGNSTQVISSLTNVYQVAYIDGDHSYEGTKADWMNVKAKLDKQAVVVFDDYHLPSKEDPGINCARAIDEIDWESEGFDEPYLVKMDRRLFLDERGLTDDQIDYGQVVAFKKGVLSDLW